MLHLYYVAFKTTRIQIQSFLLLSESIYVTSWKSIDHKSWKIIFWQIPVLIKMKRNLGY